jgi:hypothetical protein
MRRPGYSLRVPARPTFALVTPSYNQGGSIGGTLDSVIDQRYPAVEYVVIDGGSTDGAVAEIRERADRLTYWCSEPDDGMYQAINKGFAHTTGELMGWINADDQHMPWTLQTVADVFAALPEVEWLTSLCRVDLDVEGEPVNVQCTRGFNRASFERGEQVPLGWYAPNPIAQECTFWRRSLWNRTGVHVRADLQCAGDLELWARFFQHVELYGVSVPLAGARRGGANQKAVKLESACEQETMAVFDQYGIRPRPQWTGRVYPRVVRAVPPRVLRYTGLVRPTKVCVYRNGCWVVEGGWTGPA